MEYRNLSKIVGITNLHPFYIQGNGLILIKSGEARKIDRKPINSEKKKKKEGARSIDLTTTHVSLVSRAKTKEKKREVN